MMGLAVETSSFQCPKTGWDIEETRRKSILP